MRRNIFIKKIGGNWHNIKIWNDWIIGSKSGGIVFINQNLSETGELYIPFYNFSDFIIDKDKLFIQDKNGEIFRLALDLVQKTNTLPPLERFPGFSFSGKEKIVETDIRQWKDLLDEPRVVDGDKRITAVAYTQKGIDFFQSDSNKMITHFDFPGYSFIDDIKIKGNRLYIADVFGLRIIDIADVKQPRLDDRYTACKGWPKDVAVYRHYILVADVLGIKIYDKKKDFAIVGNIESNRNRVAKVVTKGDYAFLSCEALGLKVVDLSEITTPRLVSGIVLPRGIWDCTVYGDYVYLAAFTGGLLKVDCSNVKNLKQVGSYTGSEEVIGVHVNDRLVFAACSHDGFKIFDHRLNLIAEVKKILGRCWAIIENDGYLFVAAGKGGLYIYNVNEPGNPVLVDKIQTVEARDLVIQDRSLYIADGSNGVVLYSIANVHKIKCIMKIPSAAFTRGIMTDEAYIYKADGDGGLEVYER